MRRRWAPRPRRTAARRHLPPGLERLEDRLTPSGGAPPAPPPPHLESDSGRFADDNRTNVATPTFTGTADPGSRVALLAWPTPLGITEEVGPDRTWRFKAPPLRDGSYEFRVIELLGAFQSPPSDGVTVTIDTTKPDVQGAPLGSIFAAAGVPISQPVATFTDTDAGLPQLAGDYTATIVDLRDGSTSVGKVQANGHGGFDVFDTLVYAKEGHVPIHVTVTDAAGNVGGADSSVDVFPGEFLAVASVTAGPGDRAVLTLPDGSAGATLTRDPSSPGVGVLFVAEFANGSAPPSVDAHDPALAAFVPVTSFDVRGINLGGKDQAVLTFNASDLGSTGVLMYVTKSGTLARVLSSGGVAPKVSGNTVTVVIDSTSSPNWSDLRRTVFTLGVVLPPAATPAAPAAPAAPIPVVQATTVTINPDLAIALTQSSGATVADAGLQSGLGRSATFVSSTPLTFALTASQDRQVASGGGDNPDEDAAVWEAFLDELDRAWDALLPGGPKGAAPKGPRADLGAGADAPAGPGGPSAPDEAPADPAPE
jgi:hypothetical protein